MHPQSWITARELVLDRLTTPGSDALNESQISIGVAINNNKLCGCIDVGSPSDQLFKTDFPTDLNRLRSAFDFEGIQQMFYTFDFVGISAYIPMKQTNFSICQFEELMDRVNWELEFYQLSLEDLMAAGKGIQFSEFGVGGGISQNGDSPARTAEEAAYNPYFGVFGSYRNLQSWDPQAIYPLHFADEDSKRRNPTAYYDAAIVSIINTHNAMVEEAWSPNPELAELEDIAVLI
ncbi:hypothetical protein QBZ16_001204 [Prototheca wickerhamii]|uniref:Uncharacterized protein n=1 Tax=Prototheca wickerhamii TaxID=3111 RepID=A0AAD9IHK3_PROWI|nr:hypothetical protein QBZ16_001204 [Prototheca wickerhamii]